MNSPLDEVLPLTFDSDGLDKLTHYAFRYPAKFHPPVVKKLLSLFSTQGQTCLDPFCGSGTLLVEAAASGRNGIGTDIDPLAVFVSRVKTHRYDTEQLAKRIAPTLANVQALAGEAPRQADHLTDDIDEIEFSSIIKAEGLWTPPIPNLHHWFRRFVIVQLARMLAAIEDGGLNADERQFLLLCFAASIRNSSNADPTPVSGLEVTSHMKRKEEEGRQINPLQLFAKAVAKNLEGAKAYSAVTKPTVEIRVEQADVRRLSEHGLVADVIITSPPYHNAVDYYRRHQLEMYWLQMVASQADRLHLLPGYIGRPHVSRRHAIEIPEQLSAEVRRWDDRMRATSGRRADDFLQYVASMRATAAQLATTLPTKGKAVFVVGNSKFQGEEISAVRLFPELLAPHFTFTEAFSYPVKNRYMSYARRNDADINREFVLVFEKAPPAVP